MKPFIACRLYKTDSGHIWAADQNQQPLVSLWSDLDLNVSGEI